MEVKERPWANPKDLPSICGSVLFSRDLTMQETTSSMLAITCFGMTEPCGRISSG